MPNEFKDTSAKLGQFSRNLSNFQKTQLNGVSSTTGSVGRPGTINGSISNSVSRLDNTYSGGLDIGVRMAGDLETSGITQSVTSKFLASAVNKSNVYKSSLVDESTRPPLNITDVNVRIPGPKSRSTPAEKIKETKDSIFGEGDSAYGGTQFPSDLMQKNGNIAALMLAFFDYKRGSAHTKGSIDIVDNIFLPLPENFNHQFNVRLDQRDTGLTGDMVKRLDVDTVSNIQQGNLITGLGGAIGDVTNLQTAKEIAKREMLAGLDSADEIVGGLASSLAGAIPNPHPTIFFKGLNLRTFSWNWKFVPRSEADSKALEEVLKKLRKNILPGVDGPLLKYPRFVQPIILYTNKLGTFKRCMCSSMNINYMGEGTSAFYVDGSPVSVLCSMEFTEMENFTREDVI